MCVCGVRCVLTEGIISPRDRWHGAMVYACVCYCMGGIRPHLLVHRLTTCVTPVHAAAGVL